MNAPVVVRPPIDYATRIGPHSVLNLEPLLEERFGEAERDRLMQLAGLDSLPADQGLMAETPAAALHQALRRCHPADAPELTRRAGDLTGEHIIHNRMPVAALQVLRVLPPWLAAPLLANTIAKHAWTFAGSGKFKVRSRDPVVLELRDNPIVRGESSEEPLCHWHVAVFQHLFSEIVDPHLRCVETHCCATGADACRFEIR